MNNLTFQENLLLNYKYEKQQIQLPLITDTIGSGRRAWSVNLIKSCETVDIIQNPVLILELNSQTEFDFNNCLSSIILNLNGNFIDTINNKEINAYQSLLKLESKQIGSNVYIPLPFNCTSKSNGLLLCLMKSAKVSFWVETHDNDNNKRIKNFLIQIDTITFNNKPQLLTQSNLPLIVPIKTNESITKLYCSENTEFDYSKNLSEFSNLYVSTNFVNSVDKLFFYFSNHQTVYKCNINDVNNNDAYKCNINDVNNNDAYTFNNKPFESIELNVIDNNTTNINFETLVWNNMYQNSGYKLPTSLWMLEMYSKKFSNNQFVKLKKINIIKENHKLKVDFNIFAQTNNYLIYNNDNVELGNK